MGILRNIKSFMKCAKRLSSLDVDGINTFLYKTHNISAEYIDNLRKEPSFVNSVFNNIAINSLDKNKDTFIVFGALYRNILSFMPILELLKSKNYQIVIVLQNTSYRHAGDYHDQEDYKIFLHDFPVFFIELSAFRHEDLANNQSFSLLLYYLVIKTRAVGILVDEFTDAPFRNFYFGVPYIKSILPKIFSFRHSISTLYKMEEGMQEAYIDMITKYFVWGELHKKLFFTQSEKIICAGWNKTDRLKKVPVKHSNCIFVAGSYSMESSQAVINELLKISEASVSFKPHPASPHRDVRRLASKYATNRVSVLEQFDDYTEAIASCRFCVTQGSNLAAEALLLKKPLILLRSASTLKDEVYSPFPFFTIYTGRGPFIVMNEPLDHKEILALEAWQRENWHEVENYLSHLISNRFCSTEFIYNEIMESIGKSDRV